jgi:hypothetical protein
MIYLSDYSQMEHMKCTRAFQENGDIRQWQFYYFSREHTSFIYWGHHTLERQNPELDACNTVVQKLPYAEALKTWISDDQNVKDERDGLRKLSFFCKLDADTFGEIAKDKDVSPLYNVPTLVLLLRCRKRTAAILRGIHGELAFWQRLCTSGNSLYLYLDTLTPGSSHERT